MIAHVFMTVYILLTLVGIALALDAVWNTRTPQGTLAWIFALIFIPVAGIPFYVVFGSRRFNGYVRARRRGNARINKLARTAYDALKPYASTSQPTDSRAALDFLGVLPMTGGNDARLLINGHATFEAIFAAIDRATDYILVQFYIVRDDSLGRRLLKHLQDARARGVRCRVLYDEVGSSKLAQLLEAMKSAGIDATSFKTTKGPRNRFRINFRNHRKIVVCDGTIAFIGGHNVGDEYVDLVPERAPWRDTHVELVGPSALAVQLAFCADWNWATGETPELNWTARTVKEDERVFILPSGPADDVDTFQLLTLQLITGARSRIWIASPYFVPDEAILAALQLAALRGVDIRVIFPKNPDSTLVRLANRALWPDLLGPGVKLFTHGRGFMHQKVMVFDNSACVGTANLDNRSLRINFEITALIDDPVFTAETVAMLEDDFLHCTPVAPDAWAKLSVLQRLASRTARMFDPVL